MCSAVAICKQVMLDLTSRLYVAYEFCISCRYRRSYDSEFTAPLIAYHIWPALMEDSSVIIKGECVTRRGSVRLDVFNILSFKTEAAVNGSCVRIA